MDPNATPTTTTPTQTPAAAPAAPAPTVTPPADDLGAKLAAMQAAIAAQEATIASLKDEAAKRRQETRAEREAKEKVARDAGDLKELLRIADEDRAEKAKALADLAAAQKELEADATAQREWRKAAVKKLDDKAAALPDALKGIYAALPTVELKKQFLTSLPSAAPAAAPETPKAPAPPAPPAGTPASAALSATSIDLNTATVEQLQELARTDPAAFAALGTKPKPTSIVDKGRAFLGI